MTCNIHSNSISLKFLHKLVPSKNLVSSLVISLIFFQSSLSFLFSMIRKSWQQDLFSFDINFKLLISSYESKYIVLYSWEWFSILKTWIKQFNGFECRDVTSSQMLKYATVCTWYFINGTRKGATHMCQIVGIPSHSRVELQLILQDTKNYLYHKTTAHMQWRNSARAHWQKYSLFSKIVILKMNKEMNICEHMLNFCVI